MTTPSENALHEVPENLLEQGAVLRWLVDTDPNNPQTSERIARARLANQLWCATHAQVARRERGVILLAAILCLLVGYPGGLFGGDWLDQLRAGACVVFLAWLFAVRIELGLGAACDVVTDAMMERLVRERVALRCAHDRVGAIRSSLAASCTPELATLARRTGWRKGLQVWDWAHSRRRRASLRGWLHSLPHRRTGRTTQASGTAAASTSPS